MTGAESNGLLLGGRSTSDYELQTANFRVWQRLNESNLSYYRLSEATIRPGSELVRVDHRDRFSSLQSLKQQ